MEKRFPNVYDKPLKIATNPGKAIKDVYASRFDKKGNVVVEKKGEENWYQMIQSFADSVDINVLIAKYMSGDKEALNKRQAFYTDITEIPENYFDAVNQINDLKEQFKGLPNDVKEKFDYDVEKFVGSIAKGDFIELLANKKDSIQEVVDNDVEEKVEEVVNG